VHGSLITVRLSGVPAALHTAVEQGVHEALGTLTLRHELAWA
jgi:microcompartment protein CcmL/EutN